MGQVLEGMKDQNWRNIMDDRCSKARLDFNSPCTLTDATTLDQPDGHRHTDNAA